MRRKLVIAAVVIPAVAGILWCGLAAMRVADSRAKYHGYAGSGACSCSQTFAAIRQGDFRFTQSWIRALPNWRQPSLYYVVDIDGPTTMVASEKWAGEWLTVPLRRQ